MRPRTDIRDLCYYFCFLSLPLLNRKETISISCVFKCLSVCPSICVAHQAAKNKLKRKFEHKPTTKISKFIYHHHCYAME
uniref:Uncharacterized protein n=1 Tax=Octopus bimaculoides TaxID=37653 RepID=A0A0L8FVV7_OCTBM